MLNFSFLTSYQHLSFGLWFHVGRWSGLLSVFLIDCLLAQGLWPLLFVNTCSGDKTPKKRRKVTCIYWVLILSQTHAGSSCKGDLLLSRALWGGQCCLCLADEETDEIQTHTESN